MQNIQNQPTENIFTNIERTGEQFKEQFKELALKAQGAMDKQVNYAKFEAAYALSVNKKQRVETMKQVKEVRQELWEEALKKSNGDVDDACNVYDDLCAFLSRTSLSQNYSFGKPLPLF